MDELLAGDHVARLGTTKLKIVTGTCRDQAVELAAIVDWKYGFFGFRVGIWYVRFEWR